MTSRKPFRMVIALAMIANLLLSGLYLGLAPVAGVGASSLVATCTTTCYVSNSGNNNNDGLTPGTALQTIQFAVNQVSVNGTVNVLAGTYPEHVIIGKALKLQGPNAGVNPTAGLPATSAKIVPPSHNYDGSLAASAVVLLNADGITIDGMEVNGDNPNVGGGVAMNGADVNAYYGITNNFADGTYAVLAYANNTTVKNSVLRNLGEGVDLFADGAASSTGSLITNNYLDNMSSRSDTSIGVILGNNAYASITGNQMTRVYRGVQTNNFNLAGTPVSISDNRISSYRDGILHNALYAGASTFTIAGNTFTSADYATWNSPGSAAFINGDLTTRNVGLLIWSIENTVSVVVQNNNADGNAVGIAGWNLPTSNRITVTGGTLSNNQYGVQLYSCDQLYGAGQAGGLNVDNVSILNSGTAGLAVLDNPTAKSAADGNGPACAGLTQPQTLTARNVYEVGTQAPNQIGALADGAQARLTITRSALQGNATGIKISTGAQVTAAGLHFNVIVANSSAGLNTSTAVGAVDATNNWWGCNAGPGNAGCDSATGLGLSYSPWLTLRLSRVPSGATAPGGQSFALTADLIINSAAADTSGTDTVRDGTPITFAVTSGGGTVFPTSTGTVAGRASATYNASNNCGPAGVSATSDDQTVTSAVTIAAPCTAAPGPQQVALMLSRSGSGSVQANPPGGTYTNTTLNYTVGTSVQLVAIPDPGQSFIMWVVDGVGNGVANPLTITMDAGHNVQAIFVPTKTFGDVPGNRPDYQAITELASRGYIFGYKDGSYGPDKLVLRSEMAALIARSTPRSVADGSPNLLPPDQCNVPGTWDCESWNDVQFTDLAGLDPNLQRDIQALAHYTVAAGYGDGRFGPNDNVSYAQTISFITRAMIQKGYWVEQPDAPQPYSGVPLVHDRDVRTFAFYTSGMGGIPAAPSTGAGWTGPATRGWFARALYAALQSYYAVDGTLPDGRPAGGYVP